MITCLKCNAEMQDSKNFCTKCGNQLNENYVPVANNSIYSNNEVSNNLNIPVVVKSLTAKQKLGLIISGSVLAFIIAFFLIGSSLTNKDRAMSNFKKAMNEKNSKKVSSMLVSSDSSLKVSEDDVKSLLAYFDKKPAELNKALGALESPNSFINFKKQGKKLLFFDKYVFEIKPVFFNISTNYKDTKIFVNDKEVVTSDKENFTKQIGPYLPGSYKIKAVLKGDYANIENVREIDGISYGNGNQVNVNLNLNGSVLTINSDDKDAKIFINGKDTALTASDSKKLGPISLDGSLKLYLQKDFPFGSCKSEEIEIKKSYLDLDVLPSEEIKTAAENAVTEYLKSEVQAYIAQDATKLINVNEKQIDAIKHEFDNMKQFKKFYTGKIYKIDYDLDSMKFSKDFGTNSQEYKLTMNLKAYYDDLTYYETSSNKTTTEKRESRLTIGLVYDTTSKQWNIFSKTTRYLSNEMKNKKEVNIN